MRVGMKAILSVSVHFRVTQTDIGFIEGNLYSIICGNTSGMIKSKQLTYIYGYLWINNGKYNSLFLE